MKEQIHLYLLADVSPRKLKHYKRLLDSDIL